MHTQASYPTEERENFWIPCLDYPLPSEHLKDSPISQPRFHGPRCHSDSSSLVSLRRERWVAHTASPDKGLDWGHQRQGCCESPTVSVWNWSRKCCDHGVVLIYLATKPNLRVGISQTFVCFWDDICFDFTQNMELISIQTPSPVNEQSAEI